MARRRRGHYRTSDSAHAGGSICGTGASKRRRPLRSGEPRRGTTLVKLSLSFVALLVFGNISHAATPPRWETNIEHRHGRQNFDREVRSLRMKQQGVVLLPPDRLWLYQVNPTSQDVALAPRWSTAGAGSFAR